MEFIFTLDINFSHYFPNVLVFSAGVQCGAKAACILQVC